MFYSLRSRRNVVILAAVAAVLGIIVSLAGAQDDETSRPAGGTYTVQYGDVLDVLGQQWNVSVAALMQANDIKRGDQLRPGDTLVIPADAPPYGQFPALQPAAGAEEAVGQGGGGGIAGEQYVIQPNDTLDTIGQRLNVSVVSLMKANNITNSRRIYAGDVIIIPEDAVAYGEFPPLENAGSSDSTLGQGGGANTTVVQPNQTLDGIAADFNVKTSCLAEANELTNPSKVYPGQMIVIDTTCSPYDGYDVVGTATP